MGESVRKHCGLVMLLTPLLPILLVMATEDACNITGQCLSGDDRQIDQLTDLQERLICVENTLDEMTGGQRTHQRGIDCSDVYNQLGHATGEYSIWRGDDMPPYAVICHVDNQGTWTVIQRRVSDAVDFMRNWTDYRDGFGDLGFSSNFWLGLEKMHQMTKYRTYTLRIDLMDWEGETAYAEYTNFRLTDEDNGYQLKYNSYSGNAGNSFNFIRNMKFSSPDRDNDNNSYHCAAMFGGWWHNACSYSNLNGVYRVTRVNVPSNGETWHSYERGIQWYHWKNSWYQMKESMMRIRPTS